ncbi:hypothetical protein AAZX31_02G151800 [Glycine max]|uniref:Uncharacterized protein n=2 Tax=Glycine subgen. Soja TaxID=1462606 RepID=A0A0R0KXP4_SOYBN|nr:hypothetical protein JHK87_004137 [Glycine soja]KAG5063279.1 hypothetical protein JHK85_004462 [Glycine max]KAG5080222.1 hypothetical protein JHK86_004287 [Glycine max]KAH1060588.1 hypothetical protein GYH30_004178 [Glycine max]KRH71632.1 hypothetical protein GLYMA_02G159800v4 [Glycine max]
MMETKRVMMAFAALVFKWLRMSMAETTGLGAGWKCCSLNLLSSFDDLDTICLF